MKEIHLVNIETDTVVSLYPNARSVEIKGSYSQCFYLDDKLFLCIYLLFLAYPHTLMYNDFLYALEEIDHDIQTNKQIDKLIIILKQEFKNAGIKELIIKVKRKGYAISNKWIKPADHSVKQARKRFMRILKFCNVGG